VEPFESARSALAGEDDPDPALEDEEEEELEEEFAWNTSWRRAGLARTAAAKAPK